MNSILFSLDGRHELAQAIVDKANGWNVPNKMTIGNVNTQIFSDGEICVDYVDSLRGKRVYILTSPINSDNIMSLVLACDAAKRSGAVQIIPVLPYYPYARQDKKDQKRGSIGAKVMAKMIEGAGATAVMTFDLHADQIQGFFDIPLTHIEGKNVFVDYVATLYTSNLKLCGPDAGSSKRIERMAEQLMKKYSCDVPYVMIDKKRSGPNVVDSMKVIGEVKGFDIVILDDIADTLGTLNKAIDTLLEAGAKSVKAIISHPVLSGKAYENLFHSKLEKLVVSDSLAVKDTVNIVTLFPETEPFKIHDKLEVISVARYFGMAIAATNNDMSYEELKTNEKAYKKTL
jgi:ribose-phosphate pyrophosphokinase